MHMKKYMTIGAVVGTAITVERMVRYRKETFGTDKTGWEVLGTLIGAQIGNIVNVVLWPVSLVCEVKELTHKE
jgi:hypothetical protein